MEPGCNKHRAFLLLGFPSKIVMLSDTEASNNQAAYRPTVDTSLPLRLANRCLTFVKIISKTIFAFLTFSLFVNFAHLIR